MNGCFQRLGYDVMRPSQDIVCLFTRLLPNVNPEFFAVRQWCVRLVGEESTVCFAPSMPDSIASMFEVHRIPSQRMAIDGNATLAEVAKEDPKDLDLLDIQSLLNRQPMKFP
jgi:hypothetical protein